MKALREHCSAGITAEAVVMNEKELLERGTSSSRPGGSRPWWRSSSTAASSGPSCGATAPWRCSPPWRWTTRTSAASRTASAPSRPSSSRVLSLHGHPNPAPGAPRSGGVGDPGGDFSGGLPGHGMPGLRPDRPAPPGRRLLRPGREPQRRHQRRRQRGLLCRGRGYSTAPWGAASCPSPRPAIRFSERR